MLGAAISFPSASAEKFFSKARSIGVDEQCFPGWPVSALTATANFGRYHLFIYNKPRNRRNAS